MIRDGEGAEGVALHIDPISAHVNGDADTVYFMGVLGVPDAEGFADPDMEGPRAVNKVS
mgnify:CR=1 FL=1